MAYRSTPATTEGGSRSILGSALVVILCLVGQSIFADQWPHWRGPLGNGVSQDTNPPVEWSPDKNVLWRVPLPGPAGATPVVWGDRIFLSSVAENNQDLLLLCFDTSGNLLWTRKVGSGNKDVRGDEGNFASPSPSTDGTHVWIFMGNGLLACFDFDGNQVWKKDLQKEYGEFDIQFGMTSTPVVDGDRIYVQLIHGPWNHDPHHGIVVALDKITGDEIWKHKRSTDAIDECKHSYASPVIYRDEDREFLVTHGADYVIAHDLEDGSEIWRCGNLNPKEEYNNTLRFVASPSCIRGLIVVPTAKNGKVLGLRPDGRGDITDSETYVSWTMPQNTPDVPSPVIHDGIVYLCREKGTLIALDAETGEVLYHKRTSEIKHRSSPVY
ncbi:MAG: PQQ-binding-like beta-propeller repeat protein, partial [Planctomycetales bacterium]